MGKRLSVLLAVLLSVISSQSIQAQGNEGTAKARIVSYFSKYECDTDIRTVSVKKTSISSRSKSITITLSDNFARQQFRKSIIDGIERDLRKVLPSEYRDYKIVILSNNKNISDLVPNRLREFSDQSLFWNDIRYTGAPWVTDESSAYTANRGLSGVHLAVTPSHGYYFDNRERQIWKWQRPSLWCTREDLLTQSFVYPYLIPMLENAGAVVTSMRERDWQTQSVIADDQSGRKTYQESSSKGNKWKTLKSNGFTTRQGKIATDSSATVRYVHTGTGKTSDYASATWTPEIPQSGRYAVYVTYKSFSQSITDARYVVYHKGGETIFRVNQQIGGGTWVYLGTFYFEKGRSQQGMVMLDNISSGQGIVCADAVRLGGGYGDEKRGDKASGKARYLEGARYYTRFNGAPDSVFLKYDGKDDYNEDIQSRPRMTNWLSGGSVYNPAERGDNVPIELYLALHTDAGVRLGDSIVGSLGICTTQKKGGILGTGLSRDVSRDLADQVLTGLRRDITAATGRAWTVRGVLDDNYCETREPQMPSTLLELLSHQNFYDMKYAFDPRFRFVVSRSIYKSILKYVTSMHGRQYTVQPLPVDHFMIKENKESGSLRLSWNPVLDPVEPSARPDGYIVYTSIDGLAFDNGIAVRHPYYEFVPDYGHVYSFKVTAANGGGQSMPSETLSACITRRSKGTVLIVNGFQRLSGPETIESDTRLGFDIEADAGVQYMESPILCGIQKVFDRANARLADTEDELGFSGDELDGIIVKGNEFNYPYIHGTAIASGKEYSFISCSREALEDSLISLSDYPIADIILGLQRHTANDTIMGQDYSTFPPVFRAMVTDYRENGGKLIISGSFTGSDLYGTSDGRSFANSVLRFKWNGSIKDGGETSVKGLGDTFNLTTEYGGETYRLSHPDILEPSGNSMAIFAYSDSRFCAGVAEKSGKGGSVTLGFPIESIKGDKPRTKVMSSLITYLTEE